MTDALTSKINNVMRRNNSYIQAEHSRFWLIMLGFMALVFVRNILKIEFPIVVLLLYACIGALFFDRDEIMAFAVTLVPFSAAFQYRYVLLALIVIYLVKFPRCIKNLSVYIPLVLMMVWELCHALLGAFSIVSFLKGFSELIFLSFVISLKNKKFDYSFISRTFSVCVVFSCTILVLKLLGEVDYNFLTIFADGNYRLGIFEAEEESYAMNYNANSLGFMCNMALAAVLLRIRIRGINAFDSLLGCILVFYGLLTLSRSFIICLAFLAILFIISSNGGFEKKVGTLLGLCLGALFLVLLVNQFAPYIFDNIIERFSADDISGGRNELLVEYTEFVFSSVINLLFGIGLQNSMEKIYAQGFTNIEFVPHNSIQELVVLWGIPGLIMFCSMLYLMIREAKISRNRCHLINFVPILIWALMGATGQWITSGKDMLLLSFLYITLCSDFSLLKGDHYELQYENVL